MVNFLTCKTETRRWNFETQTYKIEIIPWKIGMETCKNETQIWKFHARFCKNEKSCSINRKILLIISVKISAKKTFREKCAKVEFMLVISEQVGRESSLINTTIYSIHPLDSFFHLCHWRSVAFLLIPIANSKTTIINFLLILRFLPSTTNNCAITVLKPFNL